VTKLERAAALAFLLIASPAYAQSGLSSFATELASTVLYSIVGIVMAVIGFKVVDWLTPGDLAEEVTHKENRALAVLAGSMMVGVCIIIASVLIS
jgi:uncharacterized membrane protein YjfL (UPF0719 family)